MKLDIEFKYVSFQKCSYDSMATKITEVDIRVMMLMIMVFKVLILDTGREDMVLR